VEWSYGKAVLVRLCTECHGTEVVLDPPRTVPVWIDTLFAMKDFGAKGSDEEFKTIADYLITNLARVEVNKSKAEEVVLVFGVSEKIAEELVAYRDKQGGFKTIDDLKKAPGLDAAKVDPGAVDSSHEHINREAMISLLASPQRSSPPFRSRRRRNAGNHRVNAVDAVDGRIAPSHGRDQRRPSLRHTRQRRRQARGDGRASSHSWPRDMHAHYGGG
jgi:competence protein ComEA